jgi:polyhydroxybutyrate depolymerase
MNRTIVIAVAFLALCECAVYAATCAKKSPPTTTTSAVTSLVVARPFDLDVPPHYDPATPAPLLVALHGYGASGDNVAASHWPLSAIALAHGVFVAHPNGTLDGSKHLFWNATDACCNFEGAQVDDVAYLTAIIDDVSARYRIDPKRIWVMGISNGGFMAHRLACDRADKIAAIVSLAGSTWLDPARCAPSAPVSVLEIHGADDPRIRYEGGTTREGKGRPYPSVEATVAESAAKDGCTGVLTPSGQPLGLDDNGQPTEIATWTGCPAGIGVERWKMLGAPHIPRVTRAWAEGVFAWLEQHPKPSH